MLYTVWTHLQALIREPGNEHSALNSLHAKTGLMRK